MSEPISAVAALLGYAALHGALRASHGVSSEAGVVRRSQCAVVESAERSMAWFGSKASAISDMWALVDECGHKGWDGEGATPLSPFAANTAAAFIRALPDGVPLPEFAPEPDGNMSLDWIRARTRLLSLSIGLSNRIAFAWIDGSDQGHGVAHFDGKRTPSRILDDIRETMTRDDVAIRIV